MACLLAPDVRADWLAQMAVPLIADSAARKIGAVGGEVLPVFPDGLPDYDTAYWD